MAIPPADDSCWTDLLLGPPITGFRTLAVQMLVFRLRQAVAGDASPERLASMRAELHAFFTAQGHRPTVLHDLTLLRKCPV